VGIRSFFRRFDRALRRFNDSFGGVAVADSVIRGQGGQAVDAGSVVAVVGEIEKSGTDEAREGDEDQELRS
jgi:hypothetical protein